MLNEISLVNFKKHHNFRASFGSGLVSIVGDNGAGKSTILKGILYALFGASAAGDKANFKSWSGTGASVVELKVHLPGYGLCTVTRSDKSAKIQRGDELLASGQNPVTAFLEDTLGMDAKTMRLLMYSPQGETQGLLAMGATALQRKVEDVAKMGLLDKVLGLVQTDLTELEGVLKGMGELPDTANIERSLKEEKAKLTFYWDSLLEAEAGERSLGLQLQALNRQYAQAEAAKSLLERVNKQIAETSQARALVEEEHQKLQAEFLALPASPIDTQELLQHKTIWEQVILVSIGKEESIKFAWKALEQEKSKLETLIASLAKSKAASERVDLLVQDEMTVSKELNAVDEYLRHSERELGRLNQSLQSASCIACGREFETGTADRLLREKADVETAYQTAKKKHGELQQVFSAIRNKRQEEEKAVIPNLPQAVEQTEKAVADLVEKLEAEIGTTGVTAELIAAYLERLDAQISEDKKSLEDTETKYQKGVYLNARRQYVISRYEDIKRERDKLDRLIEGLVTEQEAILEEKKVSKEDIEELKEAVQLQEVICHNAKARTLEIREQHTTCELRVKILEKSIDEALIAIKKHEEVALERNAVLALQKYLKANRARFSSSLWDGLLGYASYLLGNTTNGTLSNIRRSISGEFIVKENDYDVPVSELSGAQKSFVGLALRVAMTKVFYGKGLCLLLDEPTADATDSNAAAVAGMLRGLGSQVILVTHRSGDALNADEIIEI